MEFFLRACLLFAVSASSGHAASVYVVRDGFEDPCLIDVDRDRLANCHEFALLTDPFDPDTDTDGLSDGDEVLGTTLALDLPGLGTSPRRRDLLLEVDWVNDNSGCQFHSHRPTAATVAGVQAVFAQVPLVNPDGSTGINLIVDHGQGPLFSGGNVVTATNGLVTLDALQTAYQPVHFAANRRGYFRYSIHAHRLDPIDEYSGVAAGDANLVTLGCRITVPGYVRNVAVHELGHNLGLHHGGDIACNRKPNYNSVMNYNHAFNGLDIDCDRFADGVDHVGFSDGSRRSLDKSALAESEGVCPAGHPFAKPVDWNLNGVIDASPVAVDLACPGIEVIDDSDDVQRMRLSLYTAPNAADVPPVASDELCPSPPANGDPP